MNLLAIDTSTEYASVALSLSGKCLSKEEGVIRSHARLILPMIEQLMAEASVNFSQLDAIVFGQGPGSFTGLRIACSVAKGLAYASDLPLYPVSSLVAIANEALVQYSDSENTNVLAVIDARMNQLYWSFFDQNTIVRTEQVSFAKDIELSLSGAPLILAGVGYEAYLEQLRPAFRAQMTIYPKAEAMIRLVLQGSIQAQSAREALPLYIRNQVVQGEAHG
jgi:tRNA threonylcarbamoyladenosine biosynthesis protein TsaB